MLDVYVRELGSAGPVRVSVSSAGVQANGPSFYPALSGNGRFVAFASAASNLVENDTNGATDVFVHDRETGETTRVSVSSAGAQGDADSSPAWPPSLSADGSRIAFLSNAENLAPGIPADSNGHVFVRDLEAGDDRDRRPERDGRARERAGVRAVAQRRRPDRLVHLGRVQPEPADRRGRDPRLRPRPRGAAPRASST